MKTVSCIENTVDVWDGAVPFVMGTSMSMPNVFSVQAHAMRLLWDAFPGIVDAIEPGGSGDMYAGLTTEQREALAEVTRYGFPPRSWFDVERLARGYTGVWSVLADNLVKWDPGYFEDFWTVPGYLGMDAPESFAQRAGPAQDDRRRGVVRRGGDASSDCRCRWRCRAARPPTTSRSRFGSRTCRTANLLGATLTITSGKAADHAVYVVGVQDDLVITGVGEANVDGLTASRTATRCSSTTRCTSRSRPTTVTR